jgi:uncharacterized membrane protein (DUF2068 family)
MMCGPCYALIGHFDLNPDGHYPKILLNNADLLASADLRQAVLLVWAYAVIRLTEGYGLWKGRAWAEWLGTAGKYARFSRHGGQDVFGKPMRKQS